MVKVFGDWDKLKKLMDTRIEDAFDENVISANVRDEYYKKTEAIGRRIARDRKVDYHDRLVRPDDEKLLKKARGLVTRLKNWLGKLHISTHPDASPVAMAAK